MATSGGRGGDDSLMSRPSNVRGLQRQILSAFSANGVQQVIIPHDVQKATACTANGVFVLAMQHHLAASKNPAADHGWLTRPRDTKRGVVDEVSAPGFHPTTPPEAQRSKRSCGRMASRARLSAIFRIATASLRQKWSGHIHKHRSNIPQCLRPQRETPPPRYAHAPWRASKLFGCFCRQHSAGPAPPGPNDGQLPSGQLPQLRAALGDP